MQKGLILVPIILFVILLASIPLGSYVYIKSKDEAKPLPSPSFEQSKVSSSSANLVNLITYNESLEPQEVVTGFFMAVKNRSKQVARTFLAEYANKEVFKSTLEESNEPSLYNQEFEYKITSTKKDLAGAQAFVDVDISVAEQVIPTKIFLEKRNNMGGWKIFYSESIGIGQNTASFPVLSYEDSSPNRVFLSFDGPVEVYLTSPEKTHAGRDPVTKKVVNEINDVTYEESGNLKTYSITNMVGLWEIQVKTKAYGEYKFGARLINGGRDSVETHLIKDLNTSTWLLHYPTSREEDFRVIWVE